MLKIAFKLEFSENMISLTLHKCKRVTIFGEFQCIFAGIIVSKLYAFSDTNTIQLRTDEHGDCRTWHSELRTSCGLCSFYQLWLERWQGTVPSYWISSHYIWYALFLDFYLVNSFYRQGSLQITYFKKCFIAYDLKQILSHAHRGVAWS